MKNNMFTLQAEMDVLSYILAAELGKMAYMMPNITKSERMLYEAVQLAAAERLDPYIMKRIVEEDAIKKAHKKLLEAGFFAWELCCIPKNRK